MNTNTKTISMLAVITVLLGLNLLVVGKAAANTKTENSNLQVSPGQLTLYSPTEIDFPRTILKPSGDTDSVVIQDPTSSLTKISVVDPWSPDQPNSPQNRFHLDVSLTNLSTISTSGACDPTVDTTDCIPFTNVVILPLRASSNQTVDAQYTALDSSGNPVTNNVGSPDSVLYNTDNPITLNANYPYIQFQPPVPAVPFPNVSPVPIEIMSRKSDTLPSAGIYSVGLALHVTIPQGITAGNYQGEITFSLTECSIPSPNC